MIAASWLILIIPASVVVGFWIGSIANGAKRNSNISEEGNPIKDIDEIDNAFYDSPITKRHLK